MADCGGNWQLVWFICIISPCILPRYFFTDIRLRWSYGVHAFWPVSAGGSQITHGGFWGPVFWLHGTSCKNMLCAAGEGWLTTVIYSKLVSLWRFFSHWLSCPLCTGCVQKKVSLTTFLDTLMSDPPPQCLVWLPLMHRLANVENGKAMERIFISRRANRVGRMKSSALHHNPGPLHIHTHTISQADVYKEAHTHTHSHKYPQWRWPIGTWHLVFNYVCICTYLWCTHHHQPPPSVRAKHIHMLTHKEHVPVVQTHCGQNEMNAHQNQTQ